MYILSFNVLHELHVQLFIQKRPVKNAFYKQTLLS